jgi:hypothetical protein
MKGGSQMLIAQSRMNAGLPLYQQMLLDIVGPPILTGIWWLLAGGLAPSKNRVVQNSTDRTAFLTILLLTYFVAISITIYAHYVHR